MLGLLGDRVGRAGRGARAAVPTGVWSKQHAEEPAAREARGPGRRQRFSDQPERKVRLDRRSPPA